MNYLPRIGYACINNTLAAQRIQVNRMMVKKTFGAKGADYASAIALKNIQGLAKLIDWNIENGITFYRMSSDMFPWMSEYEFENLPDFPLIKRILAAIGEKVKSNNHRLTFHPGPFNVLASMHQSVIDKTIKELRQHGEIMDMLGLPRSPFAKINIHIGGAYGDKRAALKRFADNFKSLPENVSTRLTIENDDKPNMFSVAELYPVYEETGIPIVFDYLHHKFCMGELIEEEALLLATSTWPSQIVPVVHFSSSRKHHEDKTAPAAAHADFIYERVKDYGLKIDIMLEAKAKERALIQYRDQMLNRRQRQLNQAENSMR